jgi:hypothetical protein
MKAIKVLFVAAILTFAINSVTYAQESAPES